MSEFNGTYTADKMSHGLWYRDSESVRLILQYYDESWNFYSRDNEANEEGIIFETGELAYVICKIIKCTSFSIFCVSTHCFNF